VNIDIARRDLGALLSGGVVDRQLTALWLTSDTPWAFEAASDARATLRSHGAVMTRGFDGGTRTYIPSSVFG
jgi:hypothetical protein